MDDAGSPWNATRQTSISLREWDIPYEELKIADKIGSGRFSTGNFFVLLCGDKSQLISKCPFGVAKSNKKDKIFVRISALVSEKRLNKKK